MWKKDVSSAIPGTSSIPSSIHKAPLAITLEGKSWKARVDPLYVADGREDRGRVAMGVVDIDHAKDVLLDDRVKHSWNACESSPFTPPVDWPRAARVLYCRNMSIKRFSNSIF